MTRSGTPPCEITVADLCTLPPPEGDARPGSICGCLAWLAGRVGADHPEVRAIRGAVTTIAMVLNRQEDRARALATDLPADPGQLRPLLRDALPAAFRISRSRWANARSLLATLLIAAGWVSPECRPRLPLSGPWAQLLRRPGGVKDRLHYALRPFLRFCQRRGVLPESIGPDDLLAYEAWLEARTLDIQPRNTASCVSTAWRRQQRLSPGWPRQSITTPSRVWQKALDFSAFPASFEADVRAYMEALRHPDPLDPDAGRPLAEISIQHARRHLLRAATYLVGTGVPAERITGIAVLIEPAHYRKILLALHAEGQPMLAAAGETPGWTKIAEQIASSLVVAARRRVKPAPDVLEQLLAVRRMVRARHGGLSNRVQDRLAGLALPDERCRLYELPWRAFQVAERLLRDGGLARAAKLHETALALAIVLQHPLRLGNLASLDLEQHLLRDQRGRLVQVSIPASAVKNRTNIRFDLPADLAARIERHIDRFRPHVPGHADGTALFPGRAGRPREAQSLGRHLRRIVEQQLGKRFHPHLARHLAVDVLLEADQGNLPVAQRLLGHRRIQTTEGIYGSRVTRAANRRFAELIREQAGQASRPRGRRRA